MDLKHKAMTLYKNGDSIKSICKTLSISKERLNIYIIESNVGTKGVAKYLFFEKGKSKESICNNLEITIQELNSYLKETIEESINIQPQNGISSWVTQIINNSRKVS